MKISELGRRAWATVEPEDSGDAAESAGILYVFAAVEGEGESGVVFAHCEIATGHDACVIVFIGEVEQIAGSGDDWGFESVEKRGLGVALEAFVSHRGGVECERGCGEKGEEQEEEFG